MVHIQLFPKRFGFRFIKWFGLNDVRVHKWLDLFLFRINGLVRFSLASRQRNWILLTRSSGFRFCYGCLLRTTYPMVSDVAIVVVNGGLEDGGSIVGSVARGRLRIKGLGGTVPLYNFNQKPLTHTNRTWPSNVSS